MAAAIANEVAGAVAVIAIAMNHFVRFVCVILPHGASFDVVWPDLIASSLVGALFFSVALLRFCHALAQ